MPPDQRLWQIDESIFSEESSFASLSHRSSLQSLENSDTELEYQPKTVVQDGNGPVYKTEL